MYSICCQRVGADKVVSHPAFFTPLFLALFLLVPPAPFAATSGTFNQTDWGTATTNNATHPGNQSGWTDFSSKDTTIDIINSGADLDLGTEIRTVTHTTDTDFAFDTSNTLTHTSSADFSAAGSVLTNTQVVGGGVTLALVAPYTPAWGAATFNIHTDVGSYAGPALVDLDGDGLLDLMVGNSSGTLRAFRNTGTATAPVWSVQSSWDGPYIGFSTFTKPAAGDLDGDGDYDLLVGLTDGRHLGVENTGTATAPVWVFNSAFDGPNLSVLYSKSYATPALADLDNDGDLDLITGVNTGEIYAFSNSSSTSPDWSTVAPATWNTGEDVGSYSAPTMGDLNGDGLFDLIVGSSTGVFWAYPNIGTISSPDWGARDVTWEGIDVGSYGRFAIGDVNGDGLRDLIGGQSGGTSHRYYNVATNYPLSGTYESPVIDGAQHYGYTTFEFNANTTPVGTSLTVDVRAGDTPTFDGSWVTISSVTNGADISALGTRRYFQYVVSLATTDTSVTPTFLDATVGYLKFAGGTNSSIQGSGADATVDLAFPWAPTSTSTYDVFYNLQGRPVYRDGYLYSADDSGNSNSRFRIIDVSDPAAPTLVASTAHGNRIYDVDVDGNYAYVAVVSGLAIVDITNPAAPVTVGSVSTPGWTISVEKVGNYAYLGAWSSGGLEIVDVSNPAAPVLVGSYDTPGNGYYVSYVNGYIYLSDYVTTNGVLIFDVSDPTDPQLVNTLSTGGTTGFVAVKGNYGYMTDTTGLRIYDIIDPASPVLLATSSLAASFYPVEIRGNLLYTASGNEAKVLDITNPVAPTLVLSQPGTGASIFRVIPDKNYLYATRSSWGMEIFNLGPYATSGDYYSSVVDLGSHLGFTTLDYTTTLPAGTTLAVDVRAGDTAVVDGGWTAWQSNILNGGDISTLAARRYAQYRVRMTTTDTLVTPSLNDISINYTTYVDSAQLISSPYNTTDTTNLMGGIAWGETLPAAGTDVQIQMRTAADSAGVPGTWSSWMGPDGTSATFWNSADTHSGGCSGAGAISCTTLPPTLRDAVSDQWIQYRVTLVSSLDDTPVVSNVALTYDAVNVAGSGSVIITPVSGPTAEPSGAVTFDISLGSAPTDNVTILLQSTDLTEGVLSTSSVQFTTGDWSVPQTVTVTGQNDDVDDGDIAYQILIAAAVSTDPNYDDKVFSPIAMTNNDDDTTGVTVTPNSGVNTTETSTSFTFTVRLDSEPTADVTIGLVSSDTTEATIDIPSLLFTSADWSTPQTLTVTGVNDVIIDPATAYTIDITVTSSADPLYAAYDPVDVSATNTDDDVAGVSITAAYGYSTSEGGGFIPLSVRLTSMPTAAVTFTLESDDVWEGYVSPNFFGPTSVTIQPNEWNTGASVIIVGMNDFVVDGNVAYNIVTSAFSSADTDYNGTDPADIAMTNIDNDTYAVTVSPTTGLTTTENGGSDTFNVTLGATPTADVTIDFTSSDPSEGTISPASVTFPANVAPSLGGVTITVNGVDDRELDGNVVYTIQTTLTSTDPNYSAIDPADVAVTNMDNNRNIIAFDPDISTGEHGTVVTMADINCDGTSDLVVGGDYIQRGDVSVYFGTGSGFSAEFDQRIYTVGSKFGNDVANLGDVDGDGCDDIAVAEYGYSANRGRVHIYYGSVTGLADGDGDGLTEAADAALTIYNDLQSTAYFGMSIVADDFDNDGDTDLVIAAPYYDNDQTNEGRVFLYNNNVTQWIATYGTDRSTWPAGYRADGWLDPNDNGVINLATEATWDWVFESDQATSLLGWGPETMVSVNVNGDAYPDLVMGAQYYDNGSTDEGRVYLFYGSATGFNDADVDGIAHETDADWIAESDNYRGYLGASLANAGDIDGDGSEDLLIGAGRYSERTTTSYEGRVYLFKGSIPGGLVTAGNPDGFIRTDTESDWFVTGPYDGAAYGAESIASAGDFNGDGFLDVIIGGTGEYLTSAKGGMYVYLNDQAGSLQMTATYVDKDREVWGTGDLLGTAVGTVGDINGDGLSEVYASGTFIESTGTEPNEGTVFLYVSNVQVPAVTVTPVAGLETTESGGTATFTVVLDAPFTASTDTLTIDVTSLTTAEGTVSPVQLSFDVTDWNVPQTVTVTGVNDAVTDGNIPYTIDLAAVVTTDTAYNGIDPADVSVTNLDNDVAVEVAVTSVDATEGGIGTVTFERSGEITSPLTVDFSFGGTASGNDYNSPGTSAVIPAGSSTVTVDVQTVNDSRFEGDETIILTTLPGAGYSVGLPANTTLTIVENDVASISVLPTTKLVTTESGGTATFSVTLTSEPSADVTIDLTSSNINEGVITPSQLVFTPSSWGAKFVTVIGVDDGNTLDGDIDYSIVTAAAVSSDTDYNTLDANDVLVMNRDNDNSAIPRITLSANNPVINEAASGVFTVSRSGATTATQRVFYSVSGTAWPGGDYQMLSGAVDIQVGSSSQTVTISPLQDVAVEGDETIIVTLAPASDYIIDRPSRETIILVDDDTPAAVPFANFWIDQAAGEGGGTTVGVELSDDALNYPVTIPYTVSGSATYPSDHDAADGNIVIASGTSGSVTVNIQDDGPGDSGETIIFTMGDPANARTGTRTTHTVTTTELNEAAEVILTAVQNALDTRLVITGDGNVTVTAVVSDPNPSDSHSYDWSATNVALTDIPDADDTTFIFDPSALLDGFYKVRLTVTDNGTPNIAVDVELLLEVLATAPTLTAVDSDNDGTLDSAESYTDTDGDGLADYLDASTLLANELQLFATQTETYIMRTEAGLTLRLGDVAFAAGADGAYVTSGDISAFGGGEGNPGTVTAPDTVPNAGGGYVDFEIADLPNAGQSVRLAIPQMEALPAGAVYRKYDPDTGWSTYVENANNSIASAPGLLGVCPPPGSSGYTAGLTEGHYCVQLTIEDGGPNDMDGQANRVIEDPAQIGKGTVVSTQETGSNSNSPSSGSSGGGGGGVLHPVWLVVLFWAVGVVRLRRQPHLL